MSFELPLVPDQLSTDVAAVLGFLATLLALVSHQRLKPAILLATAGTDMTTHALVVVASCKNKRIRPLLGSVGGWGAIFIL